MSVSDETSKKVAQLFQCIALDVLGGRPVQKPAAVNAPLISQFVRDDRVMNATRDYLRTLSTLWAEVHADTPFPLAVKPRQKAPSPAVASERASTPFSPPVAAAPPAAEASVPEPVIAVAPESQPGPVCLKPGESVDLTGPNAMKPSAGQQEHSQQAVTASPTPAVPAATSPTVSAASAPAPAAGLAQPALKPGQVPAVAVAPTPPPRSVPVKFQIPNAKAGMPYCGELSARDPDGRRVVIKDVLLPANLGLTFDQGTACIHGTPLISGEFQLSVRCLLPDGAEQSGKCDFIVNPDPRSLWKCLEPADDAKYRKPHVDCAEVEVPSQPFRLIAASRRGRSHEHAGSHRDDDYCVEHIATTGWTIMIVADGAGSAQFSREGSRLAVKAAGDHLLDVLAGEQGSKMAATLDNPGELPATLAALGSEFHYLYHRVASLAVQAIEAEAAATGAQPRDFATTFLAVAARPCAGKLFVASFWMGDGAIAVYGPQGVVKLMGTPDGGEYAGQTRFLDRAALSDAGFGKRVRVGAFEGFNAVFAMTDGVSDPYFETDSGLADGQRWDRLWTDLSPVIAATDPKQSLADWLHFFVAGHHDDRTLALLWPAATACPVMATPGE